MRVAADVLDDGILYLDGRSVSAALENVDVVATVESVLVAHSRHATHLPAEAYLGWVNKHGESVRSLNMPGAVLGSQLRVGTKVINANPDNLRRGLPRAGGLLAVFCPETGCVRALMEGAQISSLRTAAVTVVATRVLGTCAPQRIALLGAGVQAQAHAHLLLSEFGDTLRELVVFDIDPARGHAFLAGLPTVAGCKCRFSVAPTAREACEGADVVIPVTTTTIEYVRSEWLAPGCLVVNVSLSDLVPEVFLVADKLYVDDWELVANDRRRTLGRLAGDGRVTSLAASGPSGPADPRSIDGDLGAVLIGDSPGRQRPDERIIVNPFGMAIEDVAVGYEVMLTALGRGLGLRLPR